MALNTEDIKREDIAEEEMTEEQTQQAGSQQSEACDETEGEKEVQEEKQSETDQGESESQEDDGEKKYLRLMADFQNYKRRVEKEKKDLYSYANEKIMGELLEVMDNFVNDLQYKYLHKNQVHI